MERPSKRRRFYAPLDSELASSFDSRLDHHGASDEVYEEEDAPAHGPDQELQQKRARLDLKLKSTFESIFEKYGKDFDGVGDEIDLYTGEILVDNGHLLQMRNERDAGDPSRALRPSRTLAEDLRGATGYVDEDYSEDGDEEDEDEDEDDEQDYDHDIPLSDEDMIEDDMILRGFAQARQFMERRPVLQQNIFDIALAGREKERRQSAVLQPTMRRGTLPSRSDIMSQFGPQLGPEIAKYVSQQEALEDDNVEPIWRAPPILTSAVGKRPPAQPADLQPEIQRPMSPDNSPSIWAPQRSRFSAEEDELLQDFVKNARVIGLDLSDNMSWKKLEDLHPRHDWKSWKTRYEKKFSYLYPGHVDESEVSTSEISVDNPWTSTQGDFVANSRLDVAGSTRQPPPPTTNGRPIRARKQAQRDSTILSWTDAVATIESVDPDLHAGLLKDVRNIKSDASFGFKRLNPSSNMAEEHTEQGRIASKKPNGSKQVANGLVTQAMPSSDRIADSEDELSLQSPGFHRGSQRVPCPHADCRSSQSTLYRLEGYDDEELSPLCLHLLHTHHITPFPCAEFNCERKGERGYFMQEDLVRHVKEVHPYATALSRLRGRVDAELLDQGSKFTHLQQSSHGQPHTPVSQPRESDFVSPRGLPPLDQPRVHTSSSNTAYDLASTPRPVQHNQAVSATASSLRVNPSSNIPKGPKPSEYPTDKLYDSDVQILDRNPFLTKSPSPSKRTEFSCSLKDSSGCNEMFTSSKLAASHSLSHNQDTGKALCTYPGCKKMVSTNASTMIAHLKTHERVRSNVSASSIPQLVMSEEHSSIQPSIPKSLSSSVGPTNKPAPIPMKKNTRSTTRKSISGPPLRNTVDASYQFSDEELDPPPLPKEIPQVTRVESAEPRPTRKSIPLFKSSVKTSSASTVTKQILITPSVKPKPEKKIEKRVVVSEEFDELSLPGDNDVMFISSQPRSGVFPKMGSQTRVKQENADVPSGTISSSRKRKAGIVAQSDEIDELGSDDVPMIHSTRRVRNSLENCEVKSEKEEAALTSKPSTKTQGATTKGRKNNKTSFQVPSQPVTTPTKSRRQSPGTNTPLIDLVRDEDENDDLRMILRSSMDSSPTARKTRVRTSRGGSGPGGHFGLRRVPRATVKDEREDGVWTPGGTLRRCGQDGFACRRPFCFSCPQQA